MGRYQSWCSPRSILGPFLFLLYINDIVHEIHSNIRLLHCTDKWLVGVNAKKTEALLISRRLARLNQRTLFFSHIPVPEVQSHKHLGIYFSDKYEWQVHFKKKLGLA